jgi:glycosyltransferase involved in cell wall biosynthesis
VQEYGLSGKNIICFAGEDWWYHHPHSKNHILQRLAQQNKVLFVNSLTMGLPAASNPDFFSKIWRKLKSMLRWLRWAPEGLWVMTPISLPLYSWAFTRWLNRTVLCLQLKYVELFLGFKDPIVWVAVPSAAEIIDCIHAQLLLYQVSDKYDANQDSATSRALIRQWDHLLKSKAAVVMYSGRKLFEESSEPHHYFLEQAVDFDHFANAASAEPAPEILRIPRPILGYFGWMDYIMDGQLVAEVARLRPDWHWVFIGNKSNLFEAQGPNIHFLGSKAYRELPRYLACIDVYVLPWREDRFTSYGSAIKVKEYLATGKPLVMSPLYEYSRCPGIRVYHTVREFISQIDDALNNDTQFDRELRQETVRGATWDRRAREVGELITSLLHRKGQDLSDTKVLASTQTL